MTPASRTPGDAFIARFLARVPADLRTSFTPAQLIAIQRAFGMRYTMQHAVDIRRYLRLPWARYYFVLLCGRDHRPRAPAFPGYAVALAALAATVALIVAL